MTMKNKGGFAWTGFFLVAIILIMGCKTLASRNVLQDNDIQWEICSYHDGTGFLSVKSKRDRQGIKFFYFQKSSLKYIDDIMLGDRNELLGNSFTGVESFVLTNGEGVKHTTLYKFPENWFISKLIGRVGETVWVYAEKKLEDNGSITMQTKWDSFIVAVENNKIKSVVSLTELMEEYVKGESHSFCWYSDVIGNIPYCIIFFRSPKDKASRFYFCYFLPCKDRWFAKKLEVEDIYQVLHGITPVVKIGNRLVSLGDKDFRIDLECERDSDETLYSKRNYFWRLSEKKYLFLFKSKERKRNKVQTKLMLFNAEEEKRIVLSEIPNGYWYIGQKNENTLVLRSFDQTLKKDLEYDLRMISNFK